MNGSFHRTVRDLHLYFGLFISPFILVFSISVFFLVHPGLRQGRAEKSKHRKVSNLTLPANLDRLSGRARIDALKPALKQAGVDGEVGWVQHSARENRLVIPVSIPGRLTTVTIDMSRRDAAVEERTTGLVDAMVLLHKSPGPHLVGMRMNWGFMRFWFWLADSTVYLLFFVTVSGIYLWYVLRAERKIGLALATAGLLSFVILVYAVVH